MKITVQKEDLIVGHYDTADRYYNRMGLRML